MNDFKKKLIATAFVGTLAVTTGCASINTAIEHRNLEVSSQMSESIFMDPVAASKRTVFIQTRNTTDQPNLSIEAPIRESLAQKGYTVVDDPEQAHYILQANLLKLAKSEHDESGAYLQAGFGGAIVGGALGSMRNSGAALGGSLLGAAAGVVANAMVDNVYYTLVTDVRLQAKAKEGVTITSQETNVANQGAGGKVVQTSSAVSEYQTFTTRVVSTANQVNLKFEEAQPELVAGLSRSIAGIF